MQRLEHCMSPCVSFFPHVCGAQSGVLVGVPCEVLRPQPSACISSFPFTTCPRKPDPGFTLSLSPKSLDFHPPTPLPRPVSPLELWIQEKTHLYSVTQAENSSHLFLASFPHIFYLTYRQSCPFPHHPVSDHLSPASPVPPEGKGLGFCSGRSPHFSS